jgi:hypothetical protein
MQQWEYVFLTRHIIYGGIFTTREEWYWADEKSNRMSAEERLNRMGDLGWELVAAVPASNFGGLQFAGKTTAFTFILKRPKQLVES